MNKSHLGVLKLSVATFIALFAGLLVAWEPGQAIAVDGSSNNAPLKRYGVVWEHKLTRSGMPEDESGWRWLRNQGVKSIVTFRQENDVDYKKFGFERVLQIPLDGSHIPTQEQTEKFLKFIQDPQNQPVHMHCSAGKDRTGMMAALARYAIDGWPLDRALAEAKLYRGSDLAPKRVAWLRDWAANHKPGSHRLSKER